MYQRGIVGGLQPSALPPGTARPPTAAAPIPFGRFELIELVGEGAMAQVFRARRKGPMGFAREVAIKRLRWAAQGPDQKLIDALINEARISGRLRHPGIVEVQEFDEVDGAYFIVMEYVQGLTLDKVIWRLAEAGQVLPEGAVIDIGRQIAAALAYAHEAVDDDGRSLALVHRDLKPQNLFLDRGGVVKIADFGLAKSTSNLHQTRSTEGAKGSPLYMSPEQIAGESVDARSDLFAVGTLLAELATGQRAFEGSSIPNTLLKVLQVDTRESMDALRQASPRLQHIVSWLWKRSPAERPPTARILLDALDRLAGNDPPGQHTRALLAAMTQEEPKGLAAPQLEHYRALRQALAEAGRWVDLPAPAEPSLELDAESATDLVVDPHKTLEETAVRVAPGTRAEAPPRPVPGTRLVDPRAPTAEPVVANRPPGAAPELPPAFTPPTVAGPVPRPIVPRAASAPPPIAAPPRAPVAVDASPPAPPPAPARPPTDAPTLPLPAIRKGEGPAWLRTGPAREPSATTKVPAAGEREGPSPSLPPGVAPANLARPPGGGAAHTVGSAPTSLAPPEPAPTAASDFRDASPGPETGGPWRFEPGESGERQAGWRRIWFLVALCGALFGFLYVVTAVWTEPRTETAGEPPAEPAAAADLAPRGAQEASIVHNVPISTGLWQDLVLSATPAEGTKGQVFAHYRPAQGGQWRQIELSDGGDGTFEIAIPVTPSMGLGVHYWLELRQGGARRGQHGSAELPHNVPVR